MRSMTRSWTGAMDGAAVGVTVIAAALGVACGGDEARCAPDLTSHSWLEASRSCREALERTRDPARAIDAATAELYLGNWGETIELASRALPSSSAADAHFLIGAAWLAREAVPQAAIHLQVAATLHARAGDAYAEASDHHQLAGVWFKVGAYGQAQRAEEASRRAALQAHDDRLLVYLDIARADIARIAGDHESADHAIRNALSVAEPAARDHPEDLVTAQLKQGMLDIERGQWARARRPIEAALARAAGIPLLPRQIREGLHLNLSYIERKAGNVTAAFEQLERARQQGTDPMQYRLNRGLIFADTPCPSCLADAAEDLAAADAEAPQGEWAWWVPLQIARVAAQRGLVREAIAADLRAIERVSISASQLGSRGATLIANHREPYLHLIGIYARAGLWELVLDVVAAMDGQSLLASSEPAFDRAPSFSGTALPRTSQRTGVRFGAAREAVEAWRGRRLIVIVPGGAHIVPGDAHVLPGEEHVWRLDIHDGRVSGRKAGDVRALEAAAGELAKDPTRADAGRILGIAMLGTDLPADTVVELLVIGPLARVPLALLGVGDMAASERYHLARARGFVPRAPAGATSADHVVVIGDSRGDLPEARREAEAVASRLGVAPLVGQAATRAAFADVRGARIAHVAGHTDEDGDGAVIRLADGVVTATEIETLSPAPALVILASCGGASGRDDAGNGSLVAAFLDAGAGIVIGTRHSVEDADAARWIKAFYANDGLVDPVRAVGAAQHSDGIPPAVAEAFEVFVGRPPR